MMEYDFTPGIDRYYKFIFTDTSEWGFNIAIFAMALAIVAFFPTHIWAAALLALVPFLPKALHLLYDPENYFFDDFDEDAFEEFAKPYANELLNGGVSSNDVAYDLATLRAACEAGDAKSAIVVLMTLIQKVDIVREHTAKLKQKENESV